MSGAPRLRPEDLDPEQRALYDAIAAGPRADGSPFPLVDADGVLTGPFNAMLLAPSLGTALQELGAAVRYRTTLTPREREITILAVAYSWDSAFESYAHEAAGRAAGLTDGEMAALRQGRADAFPDTRERLIAGLAAALAGRGDLTDGEAAAAHTTLGPAQLFELTTLVGYYATLALQLRVFRVGA